MMLPLLYEQRGFTASEMGFLGIFAPLGALVLFPILGYFSDRTRTRLGRRRPYDLIATPFWFIGLVIAPFTQSLELMILALALIGIAGAVNNVLTGFYNDVVPPELMGRFSGGMRFFGSIGVLGFQFGLLRFVDSSPVTVFLTVATVAFVCEMIMVIFVKEGEYPPPPRSKGFGTEIYNYIKEGFSSRYVIFLWLTLGVTALGAPAMGYYFVRYFTDDVHGLGMTSGQLGTLSGIGTAIGLCVTPFAGWLVDRVGPKLLWMWAGGMVGIVQIALFLLPQTPGVISVLYGLFAFFNAGLTVGLLPIMFATIPKERFGQLNGANQIVTRAFQIIASIGLGAFITFMGEDYRYAFLFGGVAYLGAPLFLILMLRQPYPYRNMPPSMSLEGGRRIGDMSRVVSPESA